MQNLKISFFGPFTLSFCGKTACEQDGRGHKKWRLIKYLILNRERSVNRRELIDATFGYGAYSGRYPEALNALNAMLHRARKTLADIGLDPHGVIVFENNTYRFVLPNEAQIDSDIFERLVQKVFLSGSLEEMKPIALRALEIYRGFFLSKHFIDEKTRLAVEKYHDTYRRIFAIACAALRRDLDFMRICEISEKACSIDPLCEDFYIERVNALLESGQKESAEKIYREAYALFEHSSLLIPSERFRTVGEELTKDSAVRILLPEKYSDKTEKIRELLFGALGTDANVKISLK